MSRAKDPVLAVLKYFETAELPLAQQALALAQAVVKRRQGRSVAASGIKPRPPVKKGNGAHGEAPAGATRAPATS